MQPHIRTAEHDRAFVAEGVDIPAIAVALGPAVGICAAVADRRLRPDCVGDVGSSAWAYPPATLW